MPVVQIDLNTLVCERLLNQDVWRAIAVHVERGNSQLRLRRRKADGRIWLPRQVEFDPERHLPVSQPALQQDRSIRLLIVVEIGGNEILTERKQDSFSLCALRQCSA